MVFIVWSMYQYIVEKSDKRMAYLLDLLVREGEDARAGGAVLAESATDKIPVFCCSPARKFKTKELAALPHRSVLACGRLNFEQIMLLTEHKVRHLNLVHDDVFTVQNSLLTAEAALALIIANTDGSIFTDKYLIVGYGRLGRALARIFHQLGMDFAVATMGATERACAKYFTQKTYTADLPLGYYGAIINTVPAQILSAESFLEVPAETLYLELASTPGTPQNAAEILPFKILNAPSLPGKYCPKQAAEILKNALMRQL